MKIEFIYKWEIDEIILYYVKFKKYKYTLIIKDQISKTKQSNLYHYVMLCYKIPFITSFKTKIELYEITFNPDIWKNILNENSKYLCFYNKTSFKLFNMFKEELKKIFNGEYI